MEKDKVFLDKFRDECGVFGIHSPTSDVTVAAAHLTYLGLCALQHRGQEGAGIVSCDQETFYAHRQMGLVSDIFDNTQLSQLKGTTAIGHVRYSTAGGSDARNVQPLIVQSGSKGWIAIAHNGNLVNANKLRQEMEDEGSIFQTTSDTEIILHLIAKSRKKKMISAMTEALSYVQGAYSLLMLCPEGLFAVRDPNGFRPLALGKLKSSYVVASETCAFDLIGAEYQRDVEPGELIHIQDGAVTSYFPFQKAQPTPCIFEFIYFARPDSLIFGQNVHQVRKFLGRKLAEEQPVTADVVVPVPDSGVPAAIGYAEASGIPFDIGIIRSHYVGRTFIEPKQAIRDFGVRIKLSAVRQAIEGRSVVVIDDSLVRGTTSKKIIAMLRQAGARQVHLRISSPPSISPCYYGIDTPRRSELIASFRSVEEIRRFIAADSLGYLSLEGMLSHFEKRTFCSSCFTGKYPVGEENIPEIV